MTGELAGLLNKPLPVPTVMPLAIKGQEAYGEGIPTAPLGACSAPSQELRAEEQESGERVGQVSHKGVLVINGSGVAPFFSIAPSW